MAIKADREFIERGPQKEEKRRGEIRYEAKKWLKEKGTYMGSAGLMKEANEWLEAAKTTKLVSENEARLWYSLIEQEIDRRRGHPDWSIIDNELNKIGNRKLELEHEYGKWEKVPGEERSDWEMKYDLVCAKINSLKGIEKGEKKPTTEDIE